MNRRTLNSARTASLALMVVLAMAVAPVASAHTSLISETPADGDVMNELNDVKLVFSEELLDIGNSVTLTDAAGVAVDLEPDLSVPRELSAPLPTDLAAGEYVLDWRVVAIDGHPLENSVAFTYAPAAVPSASTEPSVSPPEVTSESPAASLSPVASPSAEVSAAPISAPVEESSGASVWWWIVGIGLVVGIVVGFVMWRTVTRKTDGGDDPQA